MKKISCLYILIALMVLASCEGNMSMDSREFTVKVQFGDSLHYNNVSLSVVNDNYAALQQMGTAKVKNGKCEFMGQTTGARVAFLRLDSLENPFYFILEPGTTNINIDLRKWSIKGGRENARYTWALNERKRLIDERTRNRESYMKAIADTTLTLRGERQAVLRDSLLADSLQHLMTGYMNGNDAVSRIIRERFSTTQ